MTLNEIFYFSKLQFPQFPVKKGTIITTSKTSLLRFNKNKIRHIKICYIRHKIRGHKILGFFGILCFMIKN